MPALVVAWGRAAPVSLETCSIGTMRCRTLQQRPQQLIMLAKQGSLVCECVVRVRWVHYGQIVLLIITRGRTGPIPLAGVNPCGFSLIVQQK